MHLSLNTAHAVVTLCFSEYTALPLPLFSPSGCLFVSTSLGLIFYCNCPPATEQTGIRFPLSFSHIRKSQLYLTLVNNEADKGITTVAPLQIQCTPTTTSLVEAEGQISPLLSLPLTLRLTVLYRFITRCIITCLK